MWIDALEVGRWSAAFYGAALSKVCSHLPVLCRDDPAPSTTRKRITEDMRRAACRAMDGGAERVCRVCGWV
jgi:hypothetical protein